MKKMFFSVIALLVVSLSYGQAIEMLKVIPTNPAAVIDELRVYDTNNASSIQTMNVGLPFDQIDNQSNRPFQSQTLKSGTTAIDSSGNIYAGRDLFINNSAIQFSNIVVNEGGSLFTKISSFPAVNAGYLRAKTITGPTVNTTLTLTNGKGFLSGREITIDGVPLQSPFDKGNQIVKRKIIRKGITTADTNKQEKQHIYKPWSLLTVTPNSAPTVTPMCNADNNLCTSTRCDVCDSNTASSCYDVRSKTLPAVYDANGATYEKVGTIKLYCKPKDTFEQTETYRVKLQTDGSTCEQYIVYAAKNGTYVSGFTTGDNATVTNPLSNVETVEANLNQDLANVSKSVAEKCFIKCGNAAGCSASQAGEYTILIDENGNSVTFSDFANNNFCANAKYGSSDTPRWSEGSGLSCKANEKTFTVYALRCYQGSGYRLREAGSYYQKRKVICRQYSHVNAEYNTQIQDPSDPDSTVPLKDELNRNFFYPSFKFTLSGDLGGTQEATFQNNFTQVTAIAH